MIYQMSIIMLKICSNYALRFNLKKYYYYIIDMKYICYRCFYTIDKKSSFTNHLNRKKKCLKNKESYKYTDIEIDNLIDAELKYIETSMYSCNVCNKHFIDEIQLDNHILIEHRDTYITNENMLKDKKVCDNIIINNIQNIQHIQNFNINIIQPVPFDKDWDLSKIDSLEIQNLLLSNVMYTRLLEEILKNDINLNVIIEKESNFGLVYKNEKDKYINMKIKDIIENSMLKLNKHLVDLNNNLNSTILDKYVTDIKKRIDDKLDSYIKNSNNIQDNVNDLIKEKYINSSKNAISICNSLEDINDCYLKEY